MFQDIYGHLRQKNILTRQLNHNNVSHAYLFSGEEGIGKRKLAEEFAIEIIKSGIENKNRKVTLNHADIKEIGLKDETIAIKEIKALIEETAVLPLEGDYRVFIIDHADRMNPFAQNALLKTIEEPAPGNVFILVTDKPTALLPTISSRCQEIPFHDISREDKLKVLKQNGLKEVPKDLSFSPGLIIDNLKNPGHYKEIEGFYDRFLKIINGDALEVFSLSEDLSKSNELSKESITLFIRKLYTQLRQEQEANPALLKTIELLFDLLGKLSYNINLRLQWEGCLIQILMEQKN